jgi:hypothetical protein
MEKMNINIDKKLDVLTAYIKEDYISNSNLEVIEVDDMNILFHIDPQTRELVMIQVYDFSVIKRILIKRLLFLVTKNAIKTWLNTIVESFQANNKLKERFA